jgi:predicted DNA repair protein MutK
MEQVIVMAGIALIMTIGVYGLVAGIVKLDDLGLYLSNRAAAAARAVGRGIVSAAPYLMKGLSIVGTVAMFMVGGGILTHGLPFIHHTIEHIAEASGGIPGVGAIIQPLGATLLNVVFGIVAGAVVLGVVEAAGALKRKLMSR